MHGRGHVETVEKGFCKGNETNEALHLATPDEIVISRLCSHIQAVEMCDIHDESALPILACRGFVKRFEGSELAKMSGAAALLNQRRKESKAEGAASSDSKEPQEKPPCLYCGSPTFALPRQAFDSRFSDYDNMMRESVHEAYEKLEQGHFTDEADDDENDSVFTLGTGFVCLTGHIVLGMAGYPKLVESVLPQSGESLKLQRPQAVDFLLKFVVGGDTLEREEGHEFVQGLGLDQLIQIEARLARLKKVWPVEENRESEKENEGPADANQAKKDPEKSLEDNEEIRYKTFGYMYLRGDSLAGIVDLLGASVPADLLKALQDFVLTGSTNLAECERLVLEEFETQRCKKEEDKARRFKSAAAEEALREAGFKHPFLDLPSSLSTMLKAFVETGFPSLAEYERLILEEREVHQQQEERKKVLELRKNTVYLALQQAGFTPPMVPHPQSLSAYIGDSSAITLEEVVAQQKSAQVQSVNGVELAAPRTSAQEQSHKCAVVTDGKGCKHPAAKGCSNGGCGPCCRKAAEPCRLGKHRKT
ncbi:hypothetical protein KFL_003660160 [Klebsormidium nitens]|uniref:Uncharacterized protein n=1 Tax=Klebsormidium nitens TaxID=105231 RepID=A0A1Y1I9I7_KLENI|nr:hypothetical protein KFL_003660160 [Klebsormidium nitens]|eukprot:GAQ87634.1 hypothetical protein KFL_003660160 [Klebsormidium nitens]